MIRTFYFTVRTPLITLLACWLAASALGCASLRKYKVVPDSVAACRKLSRQGVAAMERGERDQACQLLDQAVTTSPTDIDARTQLADALWSSGQLELATQHIEAAAQLDSGNGPTLVRAGEMLLGSGKPERALERAEQAIRIDGTSAGAWALRGRVYRRLKQPERALADMQHALRYGPHATDVLLDISELQYEQGQPRRALATVHHVLDAYSTGEEPQRALWLEGLAYGAVERPMDCMASLTAASQRGEPSAELLFHLAKAEAAAGRPTAAAQTVQNALAIDGSHQASRVLLAQLQQAGPAVTDGTIRR